MRAATRSARLWSDADWEWLHRAAPRTPVSGFKPESAGGNNWKYRTMFEELPLPLDWPVYVSHAEAAAYARWAGKELPSEAEWHRAAHGDAKWPRA